MNVRFRSFGYTHTCVFARWRVVFCDKIPPQSVDSREKLLSAFLSTSYRQLISRLCRSGLGHCCRMRTVTELDVYGRFCMRCRSKREFGLAVGAGRLIF